MSAIEASEQRKPEYKEFRTPQFCKEQSEQVLPLYGLTTVWKVPRNDADRSPDNPYNFPEDLLEERHLSKNCLIVHCKDSCDDGCWFVSLNLPVQGPYVAQKG